MSDDPLASPPDLPKTTAEVIAAAPPPPNLVPTADDPDKNGEKWDPAKHRSPPLRNRDGTWQKLRGNAALIAQGKPMKLFGKDVAGKPKPAAAPAADPLAGEPAAAPPPAVPLPPAWSSATPGSTGAPVDAVVDEPQLRPLEAYTATARSLTLAMFGTARMCFGPEAKPDKEEQNAWEIQWRDTLHSWQTPIFGPVLGLVVLFIDSVSKRWNNSSIREHAAKTWAFITRKKTEAPPAYTAGQPMQPPAQQPASPAQPKTVATAPAQPVNVAGVYGH